MIVLIFGGTGFIGRYLVPVLEAEGYDIILFSRKSKNTLSGSKIKYLQWNGISVENISPFITGEYGIINLAGESIGIKPWTRKRKKKILLSRTQPAQAISAMVESLGQKPEFIVQISAIGYYGSRGDETITENTGKGKGFLAEIADSWERSLPVTIETRTIFLRTAPVLGLEGILKPMVLPFRLFFGGKLGNGNQWFSWIHIDDAVRAIIFLIQNKSLKGVYNLCAPNPVQNADFAKAAAKILKRPNWFCVPAILLRLILPERADELLLTSQRVIPERLVKAGFNFRINRIEDALTDLLTAGKYE